MARLLMDEIQKTFRLHHYSYRTEESYIKWIKRFILFHKKRHPREMGADQIQEFLSDLAVRGKVSASTQNQALSALLFLYQKVLQMDLPWLDDIVRAKRPVRVPIVMTRGEVARVLETSQRTVERGWPAGVYGSVRRPIASGQLAARSVLSRLAKSLLKTAAPVV